MNLATFVADETVERLMTQRHASEGKLNPSPLRALDLGGACGHRGCAQQTLIAADGVRLAVRDYGATDARHTVVLLHGFCLDQTSWTRQVGYLVRRWGESVRVVTYDHRGHGRSGAGPMSSYRIEQLGADLGHVLAELHVTGPLTLVGHSMGGMAALAYLDGAASSRIDPDGLVLVATAAGRLAERGLGRLLATPATRTLFALIQRAPEVAVRVLTQPGCAALSRYLVRGKAERATLAQVAASALASTPVTTAVGFLPALRAYDQSHTLHSITARTVVISGGADLLTPPAHARDLVAGIRGATHLHLRAGGHMLLQEAPHLIAAAIDTAMGLPAPPTVRRPAHEPNSRDFPPTGPSFPINGFRPLRHQVAPTLNNDGPRQRGSRP